MIDLNILSIEQLRARIDQLDSNILYIESERERARMHLNKRLAEYERIRVACERPVPYGC